MKNIAFLLFVICSITACNKSLTKQIELAENQEIKDDLLIQQYLKKNKIKNAEKTEEGIYYLVTKKGNGIHPDISNGVECHYKGYLLDGSEFDSSYKRGKPAVFPLRNVIKGWQIGIPKVSEGGAVTLFIPSKLAYGKRAKGPNIPANSVLVFDVELLSIASK